MKIGLAVIIGQEVELVDSFIKKNQLAEVFSEIKFLCDTSTDGTVQKLKEYEAQGLCKVYTRNLNFNFSEQRNFLNKLMESEYVLRLDIDESMNDNLIGWIKSFDGHKDKYLITRKEMVEGKVRNHTSIVFLYKNEPHIEWQNRIHEVIVGCKTEKTLEDRYLLIHDKNHKRCERQNKWYFDNFKEQRKIVDERRKGNG